MSLLYVPTDTNKPMDNLYFTKKTQTECFYRNIPETGKSGLNLMLTYFDQTLTDQQFYILVAIKHV